jgi:hypothetical protein
MDADIDELKDLIKKNMELTQDTHRMVRDATLLTVGQFLFNIVVGGCPRTHRRGVLLRAAVHPTNRTPLYAGSATKRTLMVPRTAKF